MLFDMKVDAQYQKNSVEALEAHSYQYSLALFSCMNWRIDSLQLWAVGRYRNRQGHVHIPLIPPVCTPRSVRLIEVRLVSSTVEWRDLSQANQAQ